MAANITRLGCHSRWLPTLQGTTLQGLVAIQDGCQHYKAWLPFKMAANIASPGYHSRWLPTLQGLVTIQDGCHGVNTNKFPNGRMTTDFIILYNSKYQLQDCGRSLERCLDSRRLFSVMFNMTLRRNIDWCNRLSVLLNWRNKTCKRQKENQAVRVFYWTWVIDQAGVAQSGWRYLLNKCVLLGRLPVARRVENWAFFFLWPQISNWVARRMRAVPLRKPKAHCWSPWSERL